MPGQTTLDVIAVRWMTAVAALAFLHLDFQSLTLWV
jgi:hypothetical protein